MSYSGSFIFFDYISRSLLDESDPEGAERILEALGSTMWENMIQKETTRPRLAVSTREGEEVEERTSREVRAETGTGRREGEEEGERQGTENFSEASQAIEGLFKQYCVPPSTSNSATPVDSLEAEKGLFESLGLGVCEEEGEEEEDIKAMENMFLHLREMRSKASSMPDQTRRELAAKVAITFAQLLGEDD
jgi:hypothetical protein